jgi:hypothetical protein
VCATYFADNIKDDPSFITRSGNPTTELCQSVIAQAKESNVAAAYASVAFVQNCLDPSRFGVNKDFCKFLGAQITSDTGGGTLKAENAPIGRGGKEMQLYSEHYQALPSEFVPNAPVQTVPPPKH